MRAAPFPLVAAALVAAAVMAVGGCAAGPEAARRGEPKRAESAAAKKAAKAAPGDASKPQDVAKPKGIPRSARIAAPAADWESFRRTDAALHEEIETRAAALGSGPLGSRAVELASLRLAATGRRLVARGDFEGALDALDRAVSLYGGDGYAYVYLAYVHHVRGHADRAAEFVGHARRYMTKNAGAASELEGLAASIEADGGVVP